MSEFEGCPSYRDGTVLGEVGSSEIVEASGIVVSRRNEGVLWVHNDSGDEPRIFALNEEGNLLGTYTIDGALAEDWEDIAIGPGPRGGIHYIYIADSGSGGDLPRTVYRVEEPAVDPGQTPVSRTLSLFDSIQLNYPEGKTYDAESLFVDPENGDLYIVTKSGGESTLFRKAAPHTGLQETILEAMGVIDFSSLPGNHQATGADMAPDGSLLVIRTYSHAFLWKKPDGKSVAEALEAAPCRTIDLVDEPQGEAVAFTSDGSLITTSEKTNQPIYRYDKVAQ